MAEGHGLRCPSCGHPNRPGRRFCGACGGGLAQPCRLCGAANEPDERFCGRCGGVLGATPASTGGRTGAAPAAYTPRHLADKIFHHRSALEGERKQVTVLFADVKGSMELAAQVDVEAWHGILECFFEILADGVHRFEGTVNQFTGDGIMALFGAPIAHEDHAQRACWTALHLAGELRRYGRTLRLERGLDFSVRMGVNSGEVVVGRIGDDLRMDYTAQGHTVGLAARMEQIAEAGKIYLTEHTAALVQGFFRLEELGSFAVKGVHGPVRVFELAGVGPLRTRLDVARARGFSRFVGRAVETASLDAALACVVAGSGRVVGVAGEAGVGKSRLCHEFLQRCRAAGLAVYEGHAVAHGRLVPFLPVLELLRNYFGVTDADDERAARRKIAGTLLLLDERLRDALPLVLDFLGVPDPEHPLSPIEPEARQQALAALVGRLVHAHSRREPAAIFVEDLHWIDGGSEQFLENLVDVLADARVLLLVNFRPEYRASWMARPYYEQVALAPLDAAATDELLASLLGNDGSLAALCTRIRESTVGNPFFVEEVVRTLVEGGTLAGTTGAYRLARPVEEVVIPPTVQAVLAARIDRLPEREKAVLETAAVIGKTFPEPILTRVAELPAGELAAALAALARAEFIQEESVFPVAMWAFHHPLTQEVAYRTQLADRRARLHAGVARALVEHYTDRLDECAALVAHHWERAGARLDAARWSRRAALWVGTSNYPEALRHWRQVRALVDGLPASPETAELAADARKNVLSFGVRLGAPREEIAGLFAEAAADATTDVREVATMLAGEGMIRAMAGDMATALGPLENALRVAEGAHDPALLAAVRACLAIGHGFAGNLREAIALTDRALAEAPADPRAGVEFFNFSPYVSLLMTRTWVLRELGHLVEAKQVLTKAAALAREIGELELLTTLEQTHIHLARATGDTRGVLEHARASVETAEGIGNPLSRSQGYAALGLAHFLRGEWDDAERTTEQALALLRESQVGMTEEAFQLATLAEIQAARGDARARTTAEEAVALAQRRHTRFTEAYAGLSLARVLLRAVGREAATEITAILGGVLAIARQIGGRLLEAHVHVELVALARLTGDTTAASREATAADLLYREMGVRGNTERNTA